MVLGCLVVLAAAQRPFYAGTSQKVYPELANRFKDITESSVESNTIANRVGEDNSQTTIRIPIDARGDNELVKWLNSWPRENRPFWLLNADHIEKFRDPEGIRNKQQQTDGAKNREQRARVRTYFGGYIPVDPDPVARI